MAKKDQSQKGSKISRREFLGKSLKAGAGIAAASVATGFIGSKKGGFSLFAQGKKETAIKPKEGLTSGMIG